ncbi:hypothetical protein OFN37_35795, partial [Escherichia coli]|nr:hypothetical protein [Escherichia coli]
LKLYSIVLDSNNSCKEILRVKKSLSFNNSYDTEISQENLNELTYVFNELGLDVNFKDKQIRAELKNYFNEKRKWNSRNELTELK